MISKPNNPIIARSFFYRGTFENWGRGLGLIKSKCLEVGLPEPEITSHNGNVIVVFHFDKMLNGQPLESSVEFRAKIFTTSTGKFWCQSTKCEIGSKVEHNGFYKLDLLRICCAILT